MKIVFLTPGTGSYHCGACMRDNALARELIRVGHDVTIAPMYLPMMLDGATVPGLEQTPIFFGGINVYLQQKAALFRKTPAFVDRLFNSRGLLRWAARHSHMTSAREHGEMTLEMLNIERSPFRKEADKLGAWIGGAGKPDLVCLSNALLAGFAPEMKRRFEVPVVAFFQGEDGFLDGLPDPFRGLCWTAMASRLREADARLAPSRFYGDFMQERLAFPAGMIDVVHNGIPLDGFTPADAPPPVPAIGYFARLCPEKGLGLMIDAFIHLAREMGDGTTRLKLAGACTAGEEPYLDEQKRRITRAGLADHVEWSPNPSREQKIAHLRSLTLFSVPATYVEAFGLYVLEAMACGVPVVQPQSAAFPEILGLDGGGTLVPPRNPEALAREWQRLLHAPAERAALGRAGRLSVEKHFSAQTMGEQFCRVAERLVRAAA